jgi:hypothetical protein
MNLEFDILIPIKEIVFAIDLLEIEGCNKKLLSENRSTAFNAKG